MLKNDVGFLAVKAKKYYGELSYNWMRTPLMKLFPQKQKAVESFFIIGKDL